MDSFAEQVGHALACVAESAPCWPKPRRRSEPAPTSRTSSQSSVTNSEALPPERALCSKWVLWHHSPLS